jgi:hypothetical protein
MFSALARATVAVVRITISLNASEPPSGTAELEGGEQEAFAGWLGMLKALSELLRRAEGPAEPPRLRAERARRSRAS